MFRNTQVTPGFDCMFAPCQHLIKGDHGIRGDQITHAVMSETHQGQRVSLVIGISTDQMPKTVPASWLAGRSSPPRGRGLTLHTQVPAHAGPDVGNSCEFLGAPDARCEVPYDTTLGAEAFVKLLGDWTEHSEAAYQAAKDPPEKFWGALEDHLSLLLRDPSLFVQPDETGFMADVRTRLEQAEEAKLASRLRYNAARLELDHAIGCYHTNDPAFRVVK